MALDPSSDLYPPPGADPDAEGWEQAVPGRAFTSAALTLAAVATLFPVVPAVVGMLLARTASKKGDPLGRPAVILNAIALVVGLVVAVLVSNLDVQASFIADRGWR